MPPAVSYHGAPHARLTALAREIKAKLTLARRHEQATLSTLVDVGDRLKEAKKALAHGQWDDWLSDNFELSDRTARLYMQLARHRARVDAKMATVAVLGIREALQQISRDQRRERWEKRNREAAARASAAIAELSPDTCQQLQLPLVSPSENALDYKRLLITDHHRLQMDYRIREWARWIRLGYSAGRLAAHVPPESRAVVRADTIVLLAFLQELLRLTGDPPQSSPMSISPPRS
jgi:hypothetical protein